MKKMHSITCPISIYGTKLPLCVKDGVSGPEYTVHPHMEGIYNIEIKTSIVVGCPYGCCYYDRWCNV